MDRGSVNPQTAPNNSVKFTFLNSAAAPPYSYEDEDGDEVHIEEDQENDADTVRDFMDAISQKPIDLKYRSTDQLCGCGSWRPKWLQKFANHKMYTISYVIISIVQGMIYTYFNGVLTTLEKTFGIPSSYLGFILSGNDISQILCGVLITYIAGRGSRPFWLSMGMLITAASCFIYSSAQMFYDPEVFHGYRNHSAEIFSNETEHHHVMCRETLQMSQQENEEYCQTRPSSVPALSLFFIGQFISGVGSTALFTLGFTYMDDSVKKSNFPLYMTITGALRALGPTLGYLLASSCLKIYIKPNSTPEYSTRDVRWLGAWWLGFLVIGTLQLFISFPILLFPKQLPPSHKKKYAGDKMPTSQTEPNKKGPAAKDFLKSIKRMAKNPVVVFQLMCAGPVILGMIGFSIFMPKYLEAQFGKTAAQASVLTGTSGMFMMMTGSVVGGLIVWKFKPSAFTLSIWGGISDAIYAIGIFIIMNFKCHNVAFEGVDFKNGNYELMSPCSQECECDVNVFDPICIADRNFLSPCLAGCQSISKTDDSTLFLDCTCANILNVLNVTFTDITQQPINGTTGYCPGSRGNCSYFWPYIILLATLKFVVSSTRIGGMLVMMRSVHKDDRAVGMAIWGCIASLFGFIPGPIVYGAVVDSTCLLWGKQACGKKGNCWIYDLDSLRIWFHTITIISFILAATCDFLTAPFCRYVNLYSDEPGRVLTFREGFCSSKSDNESQVQYTKTTINDDI